MSPTEDRIDIWRRSMTLWRLWLFLAWQDTKTRYSRTTLGPYWTTVSLAIWTVSIGIVYAVLFKVPIREFLPYLATGLISWNYISTVLLASPSALTEARSALLNIRIPLPVLILRIIVRTIIAYGHSLPVVLAVVLVLAPSTYANGQWLALVQLPFSLALISIVLIPVSFFIATLCTKLPDMGQVVASLVQVLFFITPILWSTDTLKDAQWIYQLNPLYYVTTTLRMPLLGQWVPWSLVTADIILGVVGIVAVSLVGGSIARKAPKWL
jgi:ABC-type polysaccharide/polyol phosphate export permease